MPIKLPDLDDRSYADLMAEAMAAIPKLYPGWTDHNASNPGITLVELFAWMTEMVLYRTNQIPDRSYEAFLRLLNGSWKREDWQTEDEYKAFLALLKVNQRSDEQPLDSAIAATLRAIREPFRAVTAKDYENLALNSGVASINRVRCVPKLNLANPDPATRFERAEGHVTLIVVPPPTPRAFPEATSAQFSQGALISTKSTPSIYNPPSGLRDFFADRKLLTTRLHVTGPIYVNMQISATLYLKDDADVATFREPTQIAHNAIFRAFHPCHDPEKPDQPGWPFGRDVHHADVFAILEAVRGVDRVDNVVITRSDNASQGHISKQGAPIQLPPHALPWMTQVTLTLKERGGNGWTPITK